MPIGNSISSFSNSKDNNKDHQETEKKIVKHNFERLLPFENFIIQGMPFFDGLFCTTNHTPSYPVNLKKLKAVQISKIQPYSS